MSDEILSAEQLEDALGKHGRTIGHLAAVARSHEALRAEVVRLTEGREAAEHYRAIAVQDAKAAEAEVARLTEDLTIANERGDAWRDELRREGDALAAERHAVGELRAEVGRLRAALAEHRTALVALVEAIDQWIDGATAQYIIDAVVAARALLGVSPTAEPPEEKK